MAKKFFVISFLLLTIGGSFLPLVTHAVNMPSIWPTGYWGDKDTGLLGCSGLTKLPDGTTILGDCSTKGFCGIVQVVLNLISFGISIAFFVLLPIFFTWGGVVILTSQGNPGKVGEGKKILTGTLVGALLSLGGYLILQTFSSLLSLPFLNISGLGC